MYSCVITGTAGGGYRGGGGPVRCSEYTGPMLGNEVEYPCSCGGFVKSPTDPYASAVLEAIGE